MELQISRTWSRIILIVIGVAFLAPVVLFAFGGYSQQNLFATAAIAPLKAAILGVPSTAALPVRLRIPKINLDTDIIYVGLTSQGAVGTPEGPTNAAWFDQSPRPGENGVSIIDGHFGWKDNIPAVFNNLYQLHVGDKIYVEDKNKVATSFVVRKIETYAQDKDPSDIFISNDGKAHLNLITCEGVWSPTQKSYSDRLVVFSDKE